MVQNLTPDRNRLLIGECDDRNCERITTLRGVFSDARLESPPVAEIREAIWSKLLTNMSLSVLCLLTGQTARGVRDDPAFADVIPRMLNEANEIAQHFIPEVKRVSRSGPAPNHKPSLLQDYELGRAMEIDVLVKAPQALRAHRRPVDADARLDRRARDPEGARQGAIFGVRFQARLSIQAASVSSTSVSASSLVRPDFFSTAKE
ncbi:ketopantoate reductase [Bradyrhizobium sp. GM6.1]